jgi:hypothetical protein
MSEIDRQVEAEIREALCISLLNLCPPRTHTLRCLQCAHGAFQFFPCPGSGCLKEIFRLPVFNECGFKILAALTF